jgi:hypothetical protein
VNAEARVTEDCRAGLRAFLARRERTADMPPPG